MPKVKVMDRNELIPVDVEDLWSEGAGTKEIADVLHVWESDVYNWMARRRGRNVVMQFNFVIWEASVQ